MYIIEHTDIQLYLWTHKPSVTYMSILTTRYTHRQHIDTQRPRGSQQVYTSRETTCSQMSMKILGIQCKNIPCTAS